MIATPRRFLEPHLSLELAGIPRSTIRVDYDELRADRPLGIVLQLENRIRDIERTRHRVDDEAATLAREADRARDDHGKPFARHDALTAARARSAELAVELAEQDKNRQQPEHTQSTPTLSPSPTERTQQPPTPVPQPQASPVAVQPAAATPAASGRDWTAQPPRSPDEHAQMAKDAAAATFAARTPITQMDRPSVERELRHVHGDTSYYSTAHAARDALGAARADVPAEQSTLAPSAPSTTDTALMASNVDPRHQIQATYSGQQVYVSYSVDINLKMHIELQSEPVGLRTRDADLVLRRISQDPTLTDITVDGRPYSTGANPAGESPHGTRRISPTSHVRPVDPNDLTRTAPSVPSESPRDRWQHLFRQAQPQILTDPHWPALAAQIERLAAAGADVAALVDQVVTERELPADHPARSLDYRLANLVPPPPPPPRPSGDIAAAEARRRSTPPAPMQVEPRPAPRSGPGR